MKNYGEEILQMVDICKVFDLGDGKKLHAAENVNVTIHKGETVGIVGESGSGKSTLAKMLTRLYSMTSGKSFSTAKTSQISKAKPSVSTANPSRWSFRTPPPLSIQSSASRRSSANRSKTSA